MKTLRETQQLIWSLITAPEGVGDGLRRLSRDTSDLESVVAGDTRLSAVERLDIYANMYFWRLLDILRGEYEAVLACIGKDNFHNLVTDYLLAFPSTHPSVRNVGTRLPQFLAKYPLSRAQPWLSELAALERASLEVFDGPDAEFLTVQHLRGLPAEAFVELPLPLVPSHMLVGTRFAVDDLWRLVESGQLATGERPADPAESPRTIFVWRSGTTIHHRPLDPLEHQALTYARAGNTFGIICELYAEHLPIDQAAPAAFALLARWVKDGIIAASNMGENNRHLSPR